MEGRGAVATKVELHLPQVSMIQLPYSFLGLGLLEDYFSRAGFIKSQVHNSNWIPTVGDIFSCNFPVLHLHLEHSRTCRQEVFIETLPFLRDISSTTFASDIKGFIIQIFSITAMPLNCF